MTLYVFEFLCDFDRENPKREKNFAMQLTVNYCLNLQLLKSRKMCTILFYKDIAKRKKKLVQLLSLNAPGKKSVFVFSIQNFIAT